jgi:ATP-dependent protease ClpP protease subunit
MGFRFTETDDPTVAELQIADMVGFENNRPAAETVPESLSRFSSCLSALSRSVREINIKIDCIGGSGKLATEVYGLLRGWPGRVVTTSEIAFSAGSVIAQAGSVRRITADGLMLIHPSVLRIEIAADSYGVTWLPATELRRWADHLDTLTAENLEIYVERSGRSVSEMRALVEKETMLTAHEAQALGLVDEVIAPTGCRLGFAWPSHMSPMVEAARRRAEAHA